MTYLEDMRKKPCPNKVHDDTWWRPRLYPPMEGPTDVIKCWRCGHEEPRFQEVKKGEGKKHGGMRRAACCCPDHEYDDECPVHGIEAQLEGR